MDLKAQTERIEKKIDFLSEKIKSLRAENVLLQLTVKNLRALKAEQISADGVQTHKSEKLRTAAQSLAQNESATGEMKEQLNQYIKELDEVIEMLREI